MSAFSDALNEANYRKKESLASPCQYVASLLSTLLSSVFLIRLKLAMFCCIDCAVCLIRFVSTSVNVAIILTSDLHFNVIEYRFQSFLTTDMIIGTSGRKKTMKVLIYLCMVLYATCLEPSGIS